MLLDGKRNFSKGLVSAVITVKDSCNRSRDDLEVTVPRHTKAIQSIQSIPVIPTSVAESAFNLDSAAIDAC